MIRYRTFLHMAAPIRARDVTKAADMAAVVTLAASSEKHIYLHRIQWSYDGTPTGGKITVQDGAGGTTLWEQAITAAGPGGQDPDELGSVNTAMVITLAAGGAGVTGRLASVRAEYVAEQSGWV